MKKNQFLSIFYILSCLSPISKAVGEGIGEGGYQNEAKTDRKVPDLMETNQLISSLNKTPFTKISDQDHKLFEILQRRPFTKAYEQLAINIIKSGVNKKYTGENLNTFLHLAAKANAKDVAALLIEPEPGLIPGADLNARNGSGETPLHLAAKADAKDVAALLINAGAHLNISLPLTQAKPLHLAAKADAKNVAALLIKARADLNVKDEYDETPLHWAAGYNSKDVAALLIQAGADVNAKAITSVVRTGSVVKKERTPLCSAAEGNAIDVAILLLQHGADVNFRAEFGKTPVDLANEQGHKKIAKLLEKYGGKSGRS